MVLGRHRFSEIQQLSMTNEGANYVRIVQSKVMKNNIVEVLKLVKTIVNVLLDVLVQL